LHYSLRDTGVLDYFMLTSKELMHIFPVALI
jgi:hypothetical protein